MVETKAFSVDALRTNNCGVESVTSPGIEDPFKVDSEVKDPLVAPLNDSGLF